MVSFGLSKTETKLKFSFLHTRTNHRPVFVDECIKLSCDELLSWSKYYAIPSFITYWDAVNLNNYMNQYLNINLYKYFGTNCESTKITASRGQDTDTTYGVTGALRRAASFFCFVSFL